MRRSSGVCRTLLRIGTGTRSSSSSALKDEIKADDVLMEAFANENGADILAALESTERGRQFIARGAEGLSA